MAWYINPTIRLLLGIIGNITALGLFTSPLPTMLRVVRKGSTEDFSSLPYICTLLNCLLWTYYGLPFIGSGRILVVTINGFGVVAEAVYLAVFLAYGASILRIRTSLLTITVLLFFSSVVAISLSIFHSSHSRSLFVGVIADVVTIAMYASPLSVMRLVIETKSVEYMPFFLSLNCFLNGVAWTVYAIYVRDFYIGVPNALGAVLGASQLALYVAFYEKKSPRDGNKGLKTTEMEAGRPIKNGKGEDGA